MKVLVNSIGADIEQIKRFSDVLNNSYFLSKCFTQNEIKYCESKANPPQHFAARFAAKEALVKATNNKKIDFSDVEVINDKTGRPYFRILAQDKHNRLHGLTAKHRRRFLSSSIPCCVPHSVISAAR